MEWILAFIFLPTIMHLIAGDTRRELNNITKDLVDEVVTSLKDSNTTKRP